MKFIFFALLVLGMANAHAQDKSNDTTARYFLIQASIGNLQEVAVSRLATERAADPAVKAFATRMVADHGKAEGQLMQLVQSGDYRLPPEATQPPVTDIMLQNVSGREFDRKYVHMMVPDHRATVSLFEKYALTGKDPVVRAFAQQLLPVLKEHLAAIVAIAATLDNQPVN